MPDNWTTATNAPIGGLGYGYDSIGRITSITGSYDPQGIPVASTGANGFDANNRQSPYNGVKQTYDATGNLTSDGTRTYNWDARNQLTSILQGTTTIASFAYDAEGRRVGKTESGQTTSYLYSGANATQETVGTTINPILVGLGTDERFARNDTGGRVYYLADHQGSTRALTDVNGNVLDRYDYDPYGNGTQTKTGYTNPYQYTGREHDLSGLYYNRARYYNPTMGRFIAEDPIGLGGGLNGYAYTGGDPLSFDDPMGLDWLDNASNFAAGAGDTLSFGLTARIRGAYDIGAVNKCSWAYAGGEATGVAIDMAMGGAAGWEAAGTRGVGKEFSHWIPSRMGGPRSLWNGNYVSTAEHALSDPYRYRFMSRIWKAENPMPNIASQQWTRIPKVYKGIAAGGAAGGVGAGLGGHCECSQ
jgi:RHS repeat-associated protein